MIEKFYEDVKMETEKSDPQTVESERVSYSIYIRTLNDLL